MKKITPFLALLSLLLAPVSVLQADEVAQTVANAESPDSTDNKPKLIKLDDPEVAGAEDEEPDCE